jgi:tripartite-type tricarboxylate transporter receptor subunit TctC
VTVWHGVLGPAGLPPGIVNAANRVFNAVMRRADVMAKVQSAQAARVVGGTPEQFAAMIQADIARWTPVIREAGLRAE